MNNQQILAILQSNNAIYKILESNNTPNNCVKDITDYINNIGVIVSNADKHNLQNKTYISLQGDKTQDLSGCIVTPVPSMIQYQYSGNYLSPLIMFNHMLVTALETEYTLKLPHLPNKPLLVNIQGERWIDILSTGVRDYNIKFDLARE